MTEYCLPIFSSAFFASAIMTALSILLANKLHVVDRPGHIKIHVKPIPRLGGIGVFGGCMAAITLLNKLGALSPAGTLAVFAGTAVVFITGVTDDVKNIPPIAKIGGQIAGAVAYTALSFSWASIPLVGLGTRFISSTVAFVGLSNGFNLMDGMNGLLAGMSSVLFASGAIIARLNKMTDASMLLLGVTAACLGFLPFNFPRARTFMGDSGSLMLGTFAATFLVELGTKCGFLSPPVLGWMTAMSVPITDTILAIARRVARGNNLLRGDREHIYDRLAFRMNGNVTNAVIEMWCLIAITAGLGVLASKQITSMSALAVTILTYVGVLTVGSALGSGPKRVP